MTTSQSFLVKIVLIFVILVSVLTAAIWVENKKQNYVTDSYSTQSGGTIYTVDIFQVRTKDGTKVEISIVGNFHKTHWWLQEGEGKTIHQNEIAPAIRNVIYSDVANLTLTELAPGPTLREIVRPMCEQITHSLEQYHKEDKTEQVYCNLIGITNVKVIK